MITEYDEDGQRVVRVTGIISEIHDSHVVLTDGTIVRGAPCFALIDGKPTRLYVGSHIDAIALASCRRSALDVDIRLIFPCEA